MKYLVMIKPRDPFFMMPISITRQVLTSMQDRFKQQEKQGKLELKYCNFDNRGIVLLYECESHDELMKYLNQIPGGGLWENKIYPLADFDNSLDGVLENMEAGDDMTPGGTVRKEG